jgi:hypothetical protein
VQGLLRFSSLLFFCYQHFICILGMNMHTGSMERIGTDLWFMQISFPLQLIPTESTARDITSRRIPFLTTLPRSIFLPFSPAVLLSRR